MKRFTLILSLMVAMVTTAMAQTIMELDADKVYTINLSATKSAHGLVYCDAEGTDLFYDATYNAVNKKNEAYHFVFTDAGTDVDGNKLYYISPVTQPTKFAYNENGTNEGGSQNSVGLTSDETVKTEKGKWYVYQNGTAHFIIPAWYDGANYTRGGCCWNAWSDSNKLGMWGSGPSNPRMEVGQDNHANIEVVNAAIVVSLSELDNSKAYLLRNANGMGYAIWNGESNLTLREASSTYTEALDAAAGASNWQIISYNNEYYLYNVGAKMFAVTQEGPTKMVQLPTPIKVEAVNGGFAFNSTENSQYYMCATLNTQLANPVQWWNKTDAGSAWEIIDNSENCTEDLDGLATVEKYAFLNPARSIVAGASNTILNAYTTDAVADLAAKLTAFDNDNTDENLEAARAAYNEVVTNGARTTISAGEKFTVKCVDTSRGYMVYSTVEGKGSETNVYLAGSSKTDSHAAIDAEGVYAEWALVENGGKTYIYNVENKKFIQPVGGVFQFTETPTAFNFERVKDGVSAMKFNSYLEVSPGYTSEAVRTIGNSNGVGAQFYIEKTGESVPADVVTVVESLVVKAWKEAALATLDYVGGYPSTLEASINAVNTLAGTTEFDNANARIQLTPGYYFVKQVSTGKYASYNANNKFATEAVEKLGIKHVLKFVQDGENIKLQVPNLGKNVSLDNASANGGSASTIVDGGSNFTVEINNSANVIIKGGDKEMRTESGGEINYWYGDTNTTWNIIPANDIEISVNEFASLYLPFAVSVEGATACAVEETASTYAILAAKNDIPAMQGAILAADGEATVRLNIIDNATSDWTNNKLQGSTTDTYVEGVAYVLANGADGIGLYKTTLNRDADGNATGTTHFKNNANKAYLVVPGASEAASYSFRFGEGTTGVDQITENREQSTVIYDLTGRRVENPSNGIYIINGVKTLVK